MIKTLRITSVITAVFAFAFFTFIIIFGDRKEQTVLEFLNSPGVREKFENDEKNRVKVSGDRVSPLVKQAEAYALYLNPPKPKRPKNASVNGKNFRPFSAPVTPKFTLLATSYCEYNPEISLALIDEPGKGRHWIRQSEKVGHLIVEKVKDGLVIVRNDQETFEIPLKESSVKSVTKDSSTVSEGSIIKRPSKTNSTVFNRDLQNLKSKMLQLPQSKYENTEKDIKAQEFISRLKDLQDTLESDGNSVEIDNEEKAKMMSELVSKFKSSRITDEEAEKLDDLGKDLKDVQDEPNQVRLNTNNNKLGTGRMIPK